jgi:hypothetical protein
MFISIKYKIIMSKTLNERYECSIHDEIIGRGQQGCVILVSDLKEKNKK